MQSSVSELSIPYLANPLSLGKIEIMQTTMGRITSIANRVIVWLNQLKTWQAALIIIVVGLCTFSTGLANPFQNDDTFQIVINTPVHSVRNIPLLFQNSTFYDGQQLTGIYYRPLMSTTFSIIYTLFSTNTVPYHLVQLALYLAGAFLLYLVFKHFLRPVLALPLVLIFLVHPINTQVVYSIPTMQDVLLFFFGMLSLWLLIRYRTTRSLWGVAICILITVLSKESGIVFGALALVYLFLFNRERLRSFFLIMILPAMLYLALRIHAVGINQAQHAAPIDEISLLGRIMTAPSIILFYVGKLVFPQKLATAYYWVYPKFSIGHVLLPIVADLAILGLFVYLGLRVRARLSSRVFQAYCLFAAWVVIGLAPYLQLIPLDMTLCETWFYFTTAGLLGMIGVALPSFSIRIRPQWLLLPVIILIVVFGVRSAIRGLDYRSQYILATRDLAVSKDDYAAMNNISQHYIDQHNYREAIVYAERSVNAYPTVSNYNNLGVAHEQLGEYVEAVDAYNRALRHNNLSIVYENLGLILMVYSDVNTTERLYYDGLKVYPHDFKLWVYKAIFDGARGHTQEAQADIATAAQYGTVPPYIYTNIMNNRPFTLPLLGKTLLIK